MGFGILEMFINIFVLCLCAILDRFSCQLDFHGFFCMAVKFCFDCSVAVVAVSILTCSIRERLKSYKMNPSKRFCAEPVAFLISQLKLFMSQ